ncbi:hypothetical protein NA57DRAFT_36449 [Rhizodiscina lignyota]|uniref:Uncharacterized protein n=1 Tax=Rhizodiscina lignyota TaxID=1504668 RepID=A0A9P4M7R3_9PEZI|nr:hypothetical protein NA57DRAFT_36449 [Rhizodiscina lignyota]
MLWLQPLLSLAIAALIVGLVVSFGRSSLTSVAHSLISGWTPKNVICSTPVLSLLPLCSVQKHAGAPEFDRLMAVQTQVDEVLANTAEYASLPLDMKRSESSIRDLKHIVRYSDLPSRNELVFEFEGFIETAKQASWDLTKFNAQIGTAVDRILSTNRWTLQVIDGVAEREGSQGAISRFLYKTLPGAVGYHAKPLDEILLNQYLTHSMQVEDQIGYLINSAQALLAILTNLDGRIDIIADLVTRDGLSVSRNKDELFQYLWTKLGGNRSTVKKLEDQLALLNDVNVYRKTAWAHVNAALLKLLAIQAALEDLRERVAVAETVGIMVPLTQHLEHVKLGVERLEGLRNEQRGVEDRKLRSALLPSASGNMDNSRLVEGKLLK